MPAVSTSYTTVSLGSTTTINPVYSSNLSLKASKVGIRLPVASGVAITLAISIAGFLCVILHRLYRRREERMALDNPPEISGLYLDEIHRVGVS